MTNAEYKKIFEIAKLAFKIQYECTDKEERISTNLKELIIKLNKKISSLEQPLCETCWKDNETKTIGKFLFGKIVLCFKCYNRSILNG